MGFPELVWPSYILGREAALLEPSRLFYHSLGRGQVGIRRDVFSLLCQPPPAVHPPLF